MHYTELEIVPFSAFAGVAMLQMGPTSGATGVVIEHIRLEGQPQKGATQAPDGIDNLNAGEGSYVNDVSIKNVGPTLVNSSITGSACTPTGTGAVTSLCIGPFGTYSGPYTNIAMTPATNCSGVMCQQTAFHAGPTLTTRPSDRQTTAFAGNRFWRAPAAARNAQRLLRPYNRSSLRLWP